jgi:hypothetical protein
MIDLKTQLTPTTNAIYELYKSRSKNKHRPHLGASQIGNECERALWYQFRWIASPEFEGRMLRLFETGDLEELRLVQNLKDIGVNVQEIDPDTGWQWTYADCGGHFGASLDGIGTGFAEGKKTPCVLEFKTMSEKHFRQVEKHGVEKSKPIYWAQVHVGMYLAGLDRCKFFAVNKNTDEIYQERIRLDMAFALQQLSKAQRVIFSDKPPAKLRNDPSFFLCKFCDYAKVCHYDELPERNCRSCAHSTPEANGTWSCAFHKKQLSVNDQRAGCDKHVYNPYAMPWPVHDAGDSWVEYDAGDGEIKRDENGVVG